MIGPWVEELSRHLSGVVRSGVVRQQATLDVRFEVRRMIPPPLVPAGLVRTQVEEEIRP